MKKKELPRLTLNRETLLKLDPSLVTVAVGGDAPPSSQICCPNQH
jgi:hypothetical protein